MMNHMVMVCILCGVLILQNADAQAQERSQISLSSGQAVQQTPRVVVEGREAPKPVILNAIGHRKRIYVDSRKQLHVSLSAPLFLRLSLSPQDPDPTYLLHGPKDSQVATPFYLDGPGRHSINHPSGHGKPGYTAYVYADGAAPQTTIRFSGTPLYMDGASLYFGKGLQAAITANDDMTGVQQIYVALDDSLYSLYRDSYTFTDEHRYRIRYYAVDNVGNSEAVAEVNFVLDTTPPSINVRFSGTGRSGSDDRPVYAPQTTLSMEAADTISGVERLVYAINSDPEKPFSQPVRFDQAGDYTVVVRAIDRVGNAENQILRFRIE